MNKDIENFVIAKKMEALRFTVQYYEEGYHPELRETTGSCQYEHAERARRNLDRFKVDVQDFRHTGRFDLLNITRTETLGYIRLYAIEQYEQAYNFSENIFIVYRSLRRAIEAIKLLCNIEPKLEIYSNKWLCSRNTIKL